MFEYKSCQPFFGFFIMSNYYNYILQKCSQIIFCFLHEYQIIKLFTKLTRIYNSSKTLSPHFPTNFEIFDKVLDKIGRVHSPFVYSIL